MKTYAQDELAQAGGANGAEALVSVDGKISYVQDISLRSSAQRM